MRKLILLCGTLAVVGTALADVRMGALFSDGMVVQRETTVPFWGWAEPGEKLTIAASWGASAATTAGEDGCWKVELKTPPAGTGLFIKIVGDNTIELKDVASGEVWFCGGQSNMDFTMKQISGKAREPQFQPLSEYTKNEIATAQDPLLRHIEVPNNPSAYDKVLDFEGSWKSVAPSNTPAMTATGYFFGRELRKHLKDVPIGLLECSWGGTRVEPWISKETYLADPEMAAYYEQEKAALQKRSNAWNPKAAKAKHEAALKKWTDNGKKGRRPGMQTDPVNNQQFPASLHNGMVSAVVPYAIKGAIWYQGESNANYMNELYEDRFSTLIRSWRKEWGRGDFPFYWVQLAAFRAPNAEPLEDDGWASICDQQRRCLKLPNTGMAVTTDIGEEKDIHPRNKVDVGKRLALWALARDYDVKVPAYSGPLFSGYEIHGGKVQITFSQVGSGLMVGHKNLLEDAVETDAPLKRFQICGKDRVWKWADATIVNKNTVEVSHPDIPNPTIVRYAWSVHPAGANLYNKEGLPASMFTTE
ncbi:sialate O-acetylesterase [Pontiellaceae bacterium B12227]|nr:sialate O-acetylesterase [Pontiellaceae bacterium B12227]